MKLKTFVCSFILLFVSTQGVGFTFKTGYTLPGGGALVEVGP